MDEIRAREDPIAVFREWLIEAEQTEPNDPTAMCLATVDPAGRPRARMVLLKGVDGRGFVFYTNLESAKGGELAHQPLAALCFHWKSLRRQVRVEGAVEPVTTEEADLYFASRARISQLGAWASDQSRPLDSRATLELRLAEVTRRFDGREVSRPPNWAGYRVLPDLIEFWRDQPFRLHDRIQFRRTDKGWDTERLYP
jgi:pyridoxamine 5'-phosphate oxidase